MSPSRSRKGGREDIEIGAEQNLLAKPVRKSKLFTVFQFVGIPGVLRVAGFIRIEL